MKYNITFGINVKRYDLLTDCGRLYMHNNEIVSFGKIVTT